MGSTRERRKAERRSTIWHTTSDAALNPFLSDLRLHAARGTFRARAKCGTVRCCTADSAGWFASLPHASMVAGKNPQITGVLCDVRQVALVAACALLRHPLQSIIFLTLVARRAAARTAVHPAAPHDWVAGITSQGANSWEVWDESWKKWVMRRAKNVEGAVQGVKRPGDLEHMRPACPSLFLPLSGPGKSETAGSQYETLFPYPVSWVSHRDGRPRSGAINLFRETYTPEPALLGLCRHGRTVSAPDFSCDKPRVTTPPGVQENKLQHPLFRNGLVPPKLAHQTCEGGVFILFYFIFFFRLRHPTCRERQNTGVKRSRNSSIRTPCNTPFRASQAPPSIWGQAW